MNATLWSIFFAVVAALATVLGGLVIIVQNKMTARHLPHVIAFGAGFMLAAAFLEMVPKSMELVGMAPAFILLGYILAHLFEHTFTPHFHFGEETHTEHHVHPAVSASAFVGLALHAFFDGVSITSGFLVNSSLGFLIALAVILHKMPEGVTIASVMLASGRSDRSSLAASAVLAVATVVGTLAMFALAPLRGYTLALSAGIATYVAATDLIPELNKRKEMRYSLSAALGVLLFFGVELLLGRLGVE